MKGSDARRDGPPWLTYALLASLAAVFACEIAFGLDPPTGLGTPSVRTLVMLGGSSRYLVTNGEWYRVISAAFLHADVIHLAFNCFALLWAGPLLEGVAGRAWFAAVYGVSAVTGAIVSLALNPPSVVSVGASGALMGLAASLLVVSFHFSDPMRPHIQRITLQALVAGLLPLAMAATGRVVDGFGHLGGMLGGALVGLILVGNWPDTARLPRLRWLASVIAAAGLAAAVLTLALVVKSVTAVRHEEELRAMLIPNGQLPRTEAEMKSQMESLAARYPRDPRLRLSRGTAMLNAGDLSGAERELRAGLEDAEVMKNVLPLQVEAALRTNLATALHRDKRDAAAKTVAGPVCRLDVTESAPQRARLRGIGICE
jgi:rhomboid protease GluP